MSIYHTYIQLSLVHMFKCSVPFLIGTALIRKCIPCYRSTKQFGYSSSERYRIPEIGQLETVGENGTISRPAGTPSTPIPPIGSTTIADIRPTPSNRKSIYRFDHTPGREFQGGNVQYRKVRNA